MITTEKQLRKFKEIATLEKGYAVSTDTGTIKVDPKLIQELKKSGKLKSAPFYFLVWRT